MSELYQQGDLLLFREPLPEATTLIQKDGCVLQHGEMTGHAHRIEGDAKLFELDGSLYVDASGEITIVHEEHRPVHLKPGAYRVARVSEFDHLAETRGLGRFSERSVDD